MDVLLVAAGLRAGGAADLGLAGAGDGADLPAGRPAGAARRGADGARASSSGSTSGRCSPGPGSRRWSRRPRWPTWCCAWSAPPSCWCSAFRALRTAWRAGTPAASPSAPAPGRRRWWGAFAEGVVVQLANPKAAVFMIAFYPQFVPADGPVFATTALLGLLQITLETGALPRRWPPGWRGRAPGSGGRGSGGGWRRSAAPCWSGSACGSRRRAADRRSVAGLHGLAAFLVRLVGLVGAGHGRRASPASSPPGVTGLAVRLSGPGDGVPAGSLRSSVSGRCSVMRPPLPGRLTGTPGRVSSSCAAARRGVSITRPEGDTGAGRKSSREERR